MNMSAGTLFNEQDKRTKSLEYHHMICIGRTKCTSEKGLFYKPYASKHKNMKFLILVDKQNLHNCEGTRTL